MPAHLPLSRTSLYPASLCLALAAAVNALAADTAVSDPREAEVRQLVDRYFRTWSAQDIPRYGQCFAAQAVVQMIDSSGELTTMPLAPFLRSQQEAHRRAAAPMTEAPESIEVRFDAKVAHALVYWKLVEGDRLQYGYDHFTLIRQQDKWRIAHLLFYALPDQSGSAHESKAAPQESIVPAR
ncbi:MAG: nuclear transport factor 2 family protein [Pirellulales bacterium]|nr:nuclear transport factor 2 family protein [Pirellulales bacterium]